MSPQKKELRMKLMKGGEESCLHLPSCSKLSSDAIHTGQNEQGYFAAEGDCKLLTAAHAETTNCLLGILADALHMFHLLM